MERLACILSDAYFRTFYNCNGFGEPEFSTWDRIIPLKSKAETMARAVELAKADYESQERRLFVKPTPYEDFLSYHKELQGVNKCQ